jgi:hypothetical protein
MPTGMSPRKSPILFDSLQIGFPLEGINPSTALLNIKISLSIALQRTNATALIDKFFEVIRRTFAPQPNPSPSLSTSEPPPSQVFNTTATQPFLQQNLTSAIDTSSDMSMDIETISLLSHSHSSSGIVLLGV